MKVNNHGTHSVPNNCSHDYVTNQGLYYKTSMIVIYDRNDSGQYYKTMITIVYL